MKERFLRVDKKHGERHSDQNSLHTILKEPHTICQKFKTTKWLDFWHERHAHYMPRFHGYGYPSLNLAEPRQSFMRTKRMTLVGAIS